MSDGKHLALADSLALAGVNHPRPCNESLAPGRTKIVDLVLRGHHRRTQRMTTRKRERIVGGIREDSTVDKPVLLFHLVGNGYPEFNTRRPEGSEFGAQQPAEGL